MLNERRTPRTPENNAFGRAAATREWCVSFGRFRLFPAARCIMKDGEPISIGGRAFDLLVALVEQPGIVLSKATLMARVWPGLNVEESSLRVHIASLRKALGDGLGETRYIANVAGRGYCFVARVNSEGFAPLRLPQTLVEDAHEIANAQGMSINQFLSALIEERVEELKILRPFDIDVLPSNPLSTLRSSP